MNLRFFGENHKNLLTFTFPCSKKPRTGNFPIPIRGLSQSAEENTASA